MVEFAGWEMPLLYSGIVEEHLHTRRAASLFDVSHMGRIELRGEGAEGLLQRVCTRQLGDAVAGQSRYSHVCNEGGGILDDVIVSRYQDRWLMVCNASNRERILSWLRQHGQGYEVEIEDRTEATMMVAAQGPAVIETLGRRLPIPIADLKRYRFLAGMYLAVPYTVFRSGYTGEDGIEMILPATVAAQVGAFLIGREAASDEKACRANKILLDSSADEDEQGLKPAGLGARDTLRIEAALPLYGHELHEGVDSISAGQGWCVDLDKDFIGVDALRRVAKRGPVRKLVGLELEGRRIARAHAAVRHSDRIVGEVTSGTLGPTLQRSIAMAYIESELAEPGQGLEVEVGAKRAAGVVVKLPFYKRGGAQPRGGTATGPAVAPEQD